MRILVLGGSAFVGRAVVEAAVGRGWEVTTFNRGRGWAHPAATSIVGDRLAWPADLDGAWDLVVDTWSGDPSAVRASASALANRAARYAYISSCSVYAPPPLMGADEASPTVAPGDGDYAACKRGGEVAVQAAFGERATILRPGLILGPHEDVGRLPWWLLRLARGGDTLAPGPRDLPLQLIDARDLAAFALDAPPDTYNTVSRRGHATMGSLLEAARDVTGGGATLRWTDPTILARHGVEAWTELPIWLPPDHEYAALHGADVEKAYAAGLRIRPAQETVRDTWAWLSALTGPRPQRTDVPAHGIAPEREAAILRDR